MIYKFSNRSKKELHTCHIDLQLIANEALMICDVDFGIMQGHRTPTEQFEYFKIGRRENDNGTWEIIGNIMTTIDGCEKKSPHNFIPSQAFDLYAYVPGKPDLSYDSRYLSYIAGIIQATAIKLFNQNRTAHGLRWGGNWDGDGKIITDQKLIDLVHFELTGV